MHKIAINSALKERHEVKLPPPHCNSDSLPISTAVPTLPVHGFTIGLSCHHISKS